MSPKKVLIVEDGFEYFEAAERLLSSDYEWIRAGDGYSALSYLKQQAFDVVLLDMCFDRIAPDKLLGDQSELVVRFGGDHSKAQQYLMVNQGNYILAAIREDNCKTPVLMSYDFDDEPKRWRFLSERFGPIDYLPDNHGPTELDDRIRAMTKDGIGS